MIRDNFIKYDSELFDITIDKEDYILEINSSGELEFKKKNKK